MIVVLGDGECNEGSVWEASLLAAAHKTGNLCVIVDFNKWQATGRSREIMAIDPLADKWRSFGWDTQEIDGHDIDAILRALDRFAVGAGRPVAIVAHTIKGSGLSFMEDDNNWHYKIPSADEVGAARMELGIRA